MAKTPARGRGSKPQSSGGGVITLAKATLLPQSTAVPRRGPFCLPGYVRQSEDRLCEPWSRRLAETGLERLPARPFSRTGKHAARPVKGGV